MGLVKDIGTQITDEDIIQMGKARNPNVGTELPKYFELFNNRIEVQLYIPPVIQCNKCLRYGHVQVHCRGEFKCYKCGEYHEDEKACDGEARYIYCNLPHYATNRQCPEYLRQLKIREIMAYYNLSLYEANMFCRQPSAPIPCEFTPLNKDGRALPIQKEDNFTTTNPPPAPKKLLYSAVTKTPIRQQRLHINTTSLNSQNKRKIPVSLGYDRAEHEKNLIKYVPSYTKKVYQNISQDSSISSPSSSLYSTTVIHKFTSSQF
ncbi:hypothetical protein HHI36_005044 [Cryptolaemus montrouzieri]|uniref:Nucleic-acid-binding protein from mobile element jockey n=1 Tax=Cryptolaemus montrouzieri TaxID=559131 RepID=A0ABD2NSZ1_9CUCU